MLGFVATIIHALIPFWQEKSSRYRRHRIKVCAGFARHFRVNIGALYVVQSACSAQDSGLLLIDIPQMLGEAEGQWWASCLSLATKFGLDQPQC
jgi:hypothetical protein